MKRLTLFVLLLMSGAPAIADVPGKLPFQRDDFTTAVAQANARKLPLFVEVWAPW